MPSPATPAVVMGGDPAPVLQIDVLSSVLGDVPLDALMAVARRDNPKRAVLVVSRLLGKHLNVAPTTAMAAGTALGQLVAAALGAPARTDAVDVLTAALHAGATPAPLVPAADQGPAAVVIAYAETATALGHLVRRALGSGPLLHTTRALPPTGALASFAEPHSHATEHLLFHDDAHVLDLPAPIVLVDDELTTGRTVMNTIEAIQRIAPRHRYVVATFLDWRPRERRNELKRFVLDHGIQVDVVTLVSGTTTIIEPAEGGAPRRATVAASTATQRTSTIRLPIGARATARRGWTEAEQVAVEQTLQGAAAQLQPHRSGPRSLVLGTEELMFVPMLLAAHLDGEVQLRSTTRSPILISDQPGYPVGDGIAYPATDGSAGLRYLYNLSLDRVDDVFLCCEDAAAYRSSALLAALRERHGRVHLVELVP